MNQSAALPGFSPNTPDYVTRLVILVSFGYINMAVCIFGCITNVINMAVFYTLGTKETINLSLFSLAIADFGAVALRLINNICVNLDFYEVNLPFVPMAIGYIVSIIPQGIFLQASILLTAIITLERCLCVTVPFKVKLIMKRSWVVFLIISIYVLSTAVQMPLFYANRIGLVNLPYKNETIWTLVRPKNHERIETVVGTIKGMLGILPYVFICACTAVLVISFKRNSEWRRGQITGDNRTNIIRREMRVCRMVMMVSAVFIACFLPNTIFTILRLTQPAFKLRTGKFKILMRVLNIISTLTPTVNCSVNIFIYATFSTRYRARLRGLFGLENRDVAPRFTGETGGGHSGMA